MGHALTMPGEWEENVDDLNFHVESMVITNRKFQKKEFGESGRFERQHEERRPPKRDERFQNRDHDDRGFERQHDDRRRPPNRDEKQPMQHDHASKRSHSSSSNNERKDQRNERQYRDEDELYTSGK